MTASELNTTTTTLSPSILPFPHVVQTVLATDGRWAPLVARLTLAVVMFPHGAQKVFGWFGGFGFAGTMDYFTGTLGIPYVFGMLAIIAEFAGPLALVVGALTRVAAVGIGVTMTVAMWTVQLQHGFFMDWFGTQAGEGIEFSLLAVGLSIVLLLSGGGAYSVDRLWTSSDRE